MTRPTTQGAAPVRIGPGRLLALGGAAVVLAALSFLVAAAPAVAHDATTTAYADVAGAPDSVDVTVELQLEYDLLMKSAWLYAAAYEATERDEQLHQLAENADAVADYAVGRFQVAYDDQRCPGRPSGAAGLTYRGGRAFALLSLTYDCSGQAGGVHTVFSALFPDSENYVHSTRTIVRYDLDGVTGSASLDAAQPQEQLGGASGATVTPREHGLVDQLWEFLLLGGEHLLLGPDHILFVLALLIGSRALRDVLLAASAFTAAHSITFLLAAIGLVDVPTAVVEPLIALSIVAVAALHLVGRRRATDATTRLRLQVVFAFGLLHGLGFAGALGIDARWSWELLWSLLAFNVGIEAAQLGLVAVLFPLLLLLRRTTAGSWAVAASTLGIAAVGLVWFVTRLPVGPSA